MKIDFNIYHIEHLKYICRHRNDFLYGGNVYQDYCDLEAACENRCRVLRVTLVLTTWDYDEMDLTTRHLMVIHYK